MLKMRNRAESKVLGVLRPLTLRKHQNTCSCQRGSSFLVLHFTKFNLHPSKRKLLTDHCVVAFRNYCVMEMFNRPLLDRLGQQSVQVKSTKTPPQPESAAICAIGSGR